MSTKGMSVIASRVLADNLCADVPLLVVRDFDKAGFSIAATIQSDSDHHQFENDITVIDLGLRLEDANAWELESEDVYVQGNPRLAEINLRSNGATEEEIEFLIPSENRTSTGTKGERVELNAFTSPQLIEWIEGKLEENGIMKLIPDANVLDEAYRRAYELRRYQRLIEANSDDIIKEAEELDVPDDIDDQIMDVLEKAPELPWDKALNSIISDVVENEL